jgi:cytochrome P450
VLTDYQEIESVCNRHADFDRAGPTAEIFQQIIPTSQIALKTNSMWKHHRRLIGPAMTSKFLGMTLPRANEAMDELVELFKVKIDKAEGRVWSVEGDMVAATMVSTTKTNTELQDVICGMAFGDSWGIIRDFQKQIQSRSPPSGQLNEAIFDTNMPQLASSAMALLDVSRKYSHVLTFVDPTHQYCLSPHAQDPKYPQSSI